MATTDIKGLCYDFATFVPLFYLGIMKTTVSAVAHLCVILLLVHATCASFYSTYTFYPSASCTGTPAVVSSTLVSACTPGSCVAATGFSYQITCPTTVPDTSALRVTVSSYSPQNNVTAYCNSSSSLSSINAYQSYCQLVIPGSAPTGVVPTAASYQFTCSNMAGTYSIASYSDISCQTIIGSVSTKPMACQQTGSGATSLATAVVCSAAARMTTSLLLVLPVVLAEVAGVLSL